MVNRFYWTEININWTHLLIGRLSGRLSHRQQLTNSRPLFQPSDETSSESD